MGTDGRGRNGQVIFLLRRRLLLAMSVSASCGITRLSNMYVCRVPGVSALTFLNWATK